MLARSSMSPSKTAYSLKSRLKKPVYICLCYIYISPTLLGPIETFSPSLYECTILCTIADFADVSQQFILCAHKTRIDCPAVTGGIEANASGDKTQFSLGILSHCADRGSIGVQTFSLHISGQMSHTPRAGDQELPPPLSTREKLSLSVCLQKRQSQPNGTVVSTKRTLYWQNKLDTYAGYIQFIRRHLYFSLQQYIVQYYNCTSTLPCQLTPNPMLSYNDVGTPCIEVVHSLQNGAGY